MWHKLRGRMRLGSCGSDCHKISELNCTMNHLCLSSFSCKQLEQQFAASGNLFLLYPESFQSNAEFPNLYTLSVCKRYVSFHLAFTRQEANMSFMSLSPKIHLQVIDFLTPLPQAVLALRRVNHYFQNLLNHSRTSAILFRWENNRRWLRLLCFLHASRFLLPYYGSLEIKKPSEFSMLEYSPDPSRRCKKCEQAREEFPAR